MNLCNKDEQEHWSTHSKTCEEKNSGFIKKRKNLSNKQCWKTWKHKDNKTK